MMYAYILLLPLVQVFGDNFVVVNTPKGPVKGRDEGTYSTFFGVPFAWVDEANPFGMPNPYPNFSKPFEAFDSTIKCPQAAFRAEGILQCLRLNIYVPKRKTSKKLPVFVWIYGGGFFFGSAGDYDGRYLVKQDIIVVAINYRLGPYGFFCLDDPKVPGNQGLKDQGVALKWIRDNIGAFGGDATKVTIAGESYGGGSVDLHLNSNFDKDFDKAIVQSGAARDEYMFVKPDYDAPIKLANLFNKTFTDNKKALKFLATKEPLEFMKVWNSSTILVRACKEKKFKNVKSFLTDDQFHLQNPRKIKDTPVLFGYNSKETFADVIGLPDEFFTSSDIFYDKINEHFNLEEETKREIARNIKTFYLGSKPVTKENMLPIVDFYSDFILNYAAENSVTRLVEQKAKVYKYLFSYIGNSNYKNVTGVGAYHTEELQYLFKLPETFGFKELTEPDQLKMRDRMTTLWGNFVKCGNPTPETTDLLPVHWTPVPKDCRPYLDIDQQMTMKQDVYHDRIAFWDHFWSIYWRNSKIIS